MRALFLLMVVSSLIVPAAGCGESSLYQLAQVSGVVTLDDKPVPGAVVTFQPISTEEETVGPGSTGFCDGQGRFDLKTVRGELGAVVASHKVTIYPANVSTNPADHPSGTDIDALARASKVKIPDRYNYQSTLTFDVDEAGTKSANFRLTSQP